ncbi:uncharacterized protein [Littorina saxatilis]|uniref:uncharacterized protein n=1 Tax=Littorina saxatilis TaxID=31220 RepID=UPI0038B579D4
MWSEGDDDFWMNIPMDFDTELNGTDKVDSCVADDGAANDEMVPDQMTDERVVADVPPVTADPVTDTATTDSTPTDPVTDSDTATTDPTPTDAVTDTATTDETATYLVADTLADDPVTDGRASNDPVAAAVAESHAIHRLRQTAFTVHEKRLDTVLLHNGIQRVSIPADGNCFFSAAALHLIGHDHQSLREMLCHHMEDKICLYEGFFETQGNNKRRSALERIHCLTRNGAWNTEANDILPLALANFTKRRIKIFTSKMNIPHFDIVPSTGKASIFKPIYLALLAPRGQPAHYDGCLIKGGRSIYTEFADKPVSMLPRDTESVPGCPRDISPEPVPECPRDITTDPVPGCSRDLSSNSDSSDEETDTESNEVPSMTNVYVTPPKKQRGRKRTAKPDSWKRNVRKKLRLTGHEYMNTKGKKVEAKQVGQLDCSKCKYKCSENFSTLEKQNIFESFYKLANYDRQKDFICHHVVQKKTRRYLDDDDKTVENKRSVRRSFFFTAATTDKKVQVCKRFFEATLAISHSYINHALTKSAGGTFSGTDGRGKSTPANKTPEATRQRVKDHIQSFPTVESHYCRKNTGRLYLDSKLNVNQMYNMYETECEKEGITPVSASLYRDIFNKEFNLSFHKPKKDQCLLCNVYKDAKRENNLTPELEQEYKEHIERKQEARLEKEIDKKAAQERDDTYAATFDMQAVLPIPSDPTSITYYKRKLSMYNLSVFSLGDKAASCYMWTEVEGHRGSNEVGTCLYKHLESLPRSVNHAIFYSDTCTGQNRNQFIVSALHHAVQNIPNIEIIDQKFLESGHSQMECDSMHAAIERASHGVKVHLPRDWITVAGCARKSGDPYTVISLDHESFHNFKEVCRNTMRNTKTNINGQRVNWLKIKWLRVTKGDGDTIFYKYRMGEPFQLLKIKGTSRRGRPQVTSMGLPSLYHSQLPISVSKKKDLVDMCNAGVIGKECKDFYKDLKTSTDTKDCLADTDVLEELDDTDDE